MKKTIIGISTHIIKNRKTYIKWIKEFPKRQRLKKIVPLMENTLDLMTRFRDPKPKKWVLSSFKEVQHEHVKSNMKTLMVLFRELNIKHPSITLARIDYIALHDWGYFLHRIIPLAKKGKLKKCRLLKDKISLEIVKNFIKETKVNKNRRG